MIIKDLIDTDFSIIDCLQIDIVTFIGDEGKYVTYSPVYVKHKNPDNKGQLKNMVPETLWDKEVDSFHVWYDADIWEEDFDAETDIELVYNIILKKGELKHQKGELKCK